MLRETCKDSSGLCLTDTSHYLLPKLQISFHAAVEYIWTRESKKEETSINIYVASLQLLSFSKTYGIHLSLLLLMTSTLQSMVVVTPTHFTLELHWKCQYLLEKYLDFFIYPDLFQISRCFFTRKKKQGQVWKYHH